MRHALAACLAGLLLVAALPAAAERPAGRIDFVEGQVGIVDAANKSRSAQAGDAVQAGDMLTTGKDGEVHLKMDDGSVLALRPDARMRIVQFQNTGKDSDSSIMSLLQGAMRSITGWIGRRAPDRVRIQTPTATIGIRGTDHETYVIPAGSDLGAPGTYDKVNAGGTRIENARGSVDVTPGQAAFAPVAAAPQVLSSVPAFFQPTRNEGRLEGLHDAIQRSLDRPAPGSGAGAGGAKGGSVQRQQGKGGVQIQGNTRINANAKDVSAVAVGSGNQAGNKVGTIGGN